MESKETIIINWPENVDITPPPTMKKTLKKVKTWATWPAIILGRGGKLCIYFCSIADILFNHCIPHLSSCLCVYIQQDGLKCVL